MNGEPTGSRPLARKMLLVTVVSLVAVALFNYLVNPFDVWASRRGTAAEFAVCAVCRFDFGARGCQIGIGWVVAGGCLALNSRAVGCERRTGESYLPGHRACDARHSVLFANHASAVRVQIAVDNEAIRDFISRFQAIVDFCRFIDETNTGTHCNSRVAQNATHGRRRDQRA